MNRTFTRLALPGILASAMLLTGCAISGGKKSAETAMPDYETAEQVKTMSPCEATVEERHPCYSIFRTTDGQRFSIGSPAATQEVVRFLGTLQEGHAYKFPGAFLNYQKQSAVNPPPHTG
jgi:hypothetical protein